MCPSKNIDNSSINHVTASIDENNKKKDVLFTELFSDIDFKIIADNINDGFFLLDQNLIFQYVNPAFEQIMNRPRNNVLGKTLTEVFPEVRDSVFEQEYTAAIRDNKLHEFETFFTVPPYVNRYIVRAYPHAKQLLVHFQLASLADKNHTILAVTEQKYQMLVNATTFPIITISRDGTYQFMNKNAAEIIGGTPEDFVGKTMLELFPKNIASRHMEHLRNVIDNQKALIQEESTIIKGELRWFESNMQPIINADGSCTQVLLTLYDTTDRRHALDAITESEQRYRLLFTRMLDAFALHEMIFDDDGKPIDFRFLEVNPSFERMTGKKAENIIGKRVLEVLPDTELSWIETYGNVVLTGEPIHLEQVHQGLNKFYEVTAFRPQEGQFVAIFKDITDRKITQEALQKSEQRLREAQSIAHLGHWEYDAVHDTALWSEETYRLYGIPLDQPAPKGDDIYRFVYEGDVNLVRSHFERCLSDGVAFDIIFRYKIPKTEQLKYFRTLAQAIRDDTGSVIRISGTIQDVTQQQLGKQALERSEQSLREAQTIAHLGSWEYDIARNNVLWSEESYRLHDVPFGTTQTLEDIYELVHPDDVSYVQEKFVQCLKTKEPFEILYRHIIPGTDTVRHLHAIAEAVCDKDGNILSFSGTVQDITEQQRAQEAIRKSEQKLREAQKIAHMGSWEYDLVNQQSYWSEETYRLHGLPVGAPVPSDEEFISLIYPDDRDMVRTAIYESNINAEPFDITYRIIDPETHAIRYIHGFAQLYTNESGTITHVTGTAQDVTQQIQTQEALRESEEQYRALFKNSGTINLIIDPDTGAIFDANDAALTFYGYSHDEICGMNIDAINTMPMDTIRQRLKEATSQDRSHFEFKHRLKSGEERNVEVHSGPVLIRGKLYLFSVIFDITEKKQLENQFMQAQRMETIGRLAGGVAHDFNNLLTVITGNAELVLSTLKSSDPFYEDISEIMHSADRAAALTRQLLAFSRRQIIEPEVINLNTILVNMDRMMRRLIGEHIQFVTLLDENLWMIKTDPGQMEQVITNLVVNARDAMSNGGKLTIETKNISIDETYVERHIEMTAGDYVVLMVSDTGLGMDEETKSHIFEPFFTTKEQGRGTGLGLSTCWGIVRQNNGFIWVYSEPDQGTIMKIYIPRDTSKGKPRLRPQKDRTAIGGTETVLVVEDEPNVNRMITKVLSGAGYTVMQANNGEEALRIVAQQGLKNISLLITDVVMPQMGGPELVRKINKYSDCTKVLYTSGYTDDSIIKSGVLEDNVEFLQKPFTPLSLLEKVRHVLDS